MSNFCCSLTRSLTANFTGVAWAMNTPIHVLIKVRWEMKGTQINHLKPFTSAWFVFWMTCENTWSHHHTQTSSTGAFTLYGEAVCFSAVSWWKSIHTEILDANNVGHVKESTVHQTLLVVPEFPWEQVCLINTEMHYILNGTITNPYWNKIINPYFVIVPSSEQHKLNFIFMNSNAPRSRSYSSLTNNC